MGGSNPREKKNQKTKKLGKKRKKSGGGIFVGDIFGILSCFRFVLAVFFVFFLFLERKEGELVLLERKT